jgi:hypothetical protein
MLEILVAAIMLVSLILYALTGETTSYNVIRLKGDCPLTYNFLHTEASPLKQGSWSALLQFLHHFFSSGWSFYLAL